MYILSDKLSGLARMSMMWRIPILSGKEKRKRKPSLWRFVVRMLEFLFSSLGWNFAYYYLFIITICTIIWSDFFLSLPIARNKTGTGKGTNERVGPGSILTTPMFKAEDVADATCYIWYIKAPTGWVGSGHSHSSMILLSNAGSSLRKKGWKEQGAGKKNEGGEDYAMINNI